VDKSLSSSIDFNDVSDPPCIVGTTYTNNDNITILDVRSSPCVGKIPSALGQEDLSSSHFEFNLNHRSYEV